VLDKTSESDISIILAEYSQFEEVNFKNESDLNKNLSHILPPREVFMSTIFLVQDADNIFELAPKERLEVLKNVFWLLGIDDAKTIISDEKRNIWTKLKIKTDTTNFDKKLKNSLDDYLKSVNLLKNTDNNIFEDFWKNYEELFKELNFVADKIDINNFSLDNWLAGIHVKIRNKVDNKKKEYQKIMHELETIQDKEKELTAEHNEKQKKEKLYSLELEEVVKKIQDIDPEKIIKLKKERELVWQNKKKLDNNLPQEIIIDFYNKNYNAFFWDFWQQSRAINDFFSIREVYDIINHLSKEWKLYKEIINTIDLKIKNTEQQIKWEIKQIETNIIHLKERQSTEILQIKNLEKEILEFDGYIDKQAKYFCEKITGNCPFIKSINKQSFDQLNNQKANKKLDLNNVIKKLDAENYDKKIKELEENKIMLEKKLESWDKLDIFDKEKKWKENLLKKIKKFLVEINWKSLHDLYQEYQIFEKQQKLLDNEIDTLEKSQEQLKNHELQQEKLHTQIKSLHIEIIDLVKKIDLKVEQKKQVKQQIGVIDQQQIQKWEKENNGAERSLEQIYSLIEDYKESQLEVKQLRQDELIVNNLYKIFSKELLLIALQDSLPILGDIVNNYLQQVVEYEISFKLDNAQGKSLELEAKIIDSKGEREVKSLSWWQKVLLKLVWMLAISSFLGSPMLFLDETINNLDAETVGKVADMLADFVKQRNMKLFTVTHSQQIQEMDIWDEIISL